MKLREEDFTGFEDSSGYNIKNDIIKQILENQEKLETLRKFLRDPLNDPETHSIVFHNPEYGKFLKKILEDKA